MLDLTTNQEFMKLLSQLSDEEILDVLAEADPVLWAERMRTLRGEPFSLRERRYLWDVYRDESQKVVLLKSRQIEGTETTENLILSFLYRHPYTTCVHCFPRTKQAQNHAKTRLLPAIQESEPLGKWHSDRGSELMLQKFEREVDGKQAYSYYALTGVFAGGSGEVGDSIRGLSTDFVALDELQDMNAEELPTILEGMSHSKYKCQLALGTPKLVNDALYTTWLASDMKEWHVTCPKCGRQHPMKFELIIDDGSNPSKPNYIYACPDCGAELTDEVRANGHWEATGSTDAEYSGYHITQLIVPWISANEIMEKKNSVAYPTRRFMTEVLGEPYIGDDNPISELMLEACIKPYRRGTVRQGDSLFGGVDWGKKSWATVYNQRHELIDWKIIDNAERDKHPEEASKFFSKYKSRLSKIVVDAGPSIGDYYTLRKKCKEMGIYASVWACYFNSPPQAPEESWSETQGVVRVGRTEIIEKVIEDMRATRWGFPESINGTPDKELIWRHFTNIASEFNTTTSGNEFLQFISTGDDHILFSSIYARLATGDTVVGSLGSTYDTAIQNPRQQRDMSPSEYRDKLDRTANTGAFLRPNRQTNRMSAQSDRMRRKGTHQSRQKRFNKW